MRLCHNINSPLRVGETKTIERWGDSNSAQIGGGVIGDEDDEESIVDSEQSTKTEDSDTNDEVGAQANDDADDKDADADDDKEEDIDTDLV